MKLKNKPKRGETGWRGGGSAYPKRHANVEKDKKAKTALGGRIRTSKVSKKTWEKGGCLMQETK